LGKRIGKWLGGYVRLNGNGTKTYVIEKWLSGCRAHVSTGCATERAALKELERFELCGDPAAYCPAATSQKFLFSVELVRDWDFAHHHSAETTRRFYVDLAIPKPPIPLRRLDG
jgi:hypothetical protein